jgi:hypothetical protein
VSIRRSTAFVLALTLSLVVVTSGAWAYTGPVLSPAEVVDIDRFLDGEVIGVEGEAVGEALRAMGGGRWVNLLGDEVGLGVWMTDDMVAQIEYFGDHRHTGDIVRVVGRVSVACEQHAGEFDVHAEEIVIIRRGAVRHHEVRPDLAVVGVFAATAAFALWRVYLRRRETLAS